MSRLELFPKSKPLDDPPEPQHTLRHGHRTPCYALAWAGPSEDYEKGLPVDAIGNLSDTIRSIWLKEYKFPPAQVPVAYFGADGNFYLIAMFNHRVFPDFAERSQKPDDPLLVAARDVMHIPPEWEGSLKWYRFPMRWPLYSCGKEVSR
ncbi:hypothetical protein AURDEDRAFT_157982 [Auricularia subglabra TFB-10046 SS5]|nr:hypothetical protein AURDEDRAFT_157982 [Auricularia subglabra TFB-10046 SS5]